MSFVMSAEEREQFLAGLHVGVLSVAAGDDRGPLAVPVWYDYRAGGQVSVITGRGTRKGRAIRAAGRMSLCAQDESPPYRYVSVEGPVVIEELDPASGWRWPGVTWASRAATSTWRAIPTRIARW
jgi:nitroimidazol reductase NimA-like FMN-containing flavoprotein (pyridoxamine 5'-phosphate oxidase superfamily)